MIGNRFHLGCLVFLALASAACGQMNHNKTVACYFENWSFYRPPPVKFDISSIDTDLCTHGIYIAADIDNVSWTIFAADPWFDLDSSDCEPGYCNYNGYRRFTDLADEDFIPILALGGWTGSSAKFSIMAKDPIKRYTFVDSVIPFLKAYGFAGLELRWEYPGQGEGSSPDDQKSLTRLVEALKERFEQEDLLLMLLVNVQANELEIGYDFPALSESVDLFSVSTYDFNFYSPDRNFTGHPSPIRSRVEEQDESHPGYLQNVYDGIRQVLDLGVPTEKILLGINGEGRGFTLEDAEDNGLYCPATEPIPAGPFTAIPGYWAYFEVLEAQSADDLPALPEATPKEWTIVTDDCYQAPYMVNGPYWVGYEDVISVAIKANFVNFAELGGVAFSSLDSDDFKGLFSSKYPLLNQINKQLSAGNDFDPETFDCGSAPAPICDVDAF
uniref:Chitinase 9 n=1 Tax=Tigriopus japonicus TaxID=158387 RepID=A0A1U9XQT9_TIGJA|nr:chitinase 9 [Tigriopus japonicus]